MKSQRLLIILTGLLALVGVFALINSSLQEDTVYVDAAAYQEARNRGDVPFGSPVLPECATDILVARGIDGIQSVAFDCTEESAREAFIAELEREGKWDVATFHDVRLSMTRSQEE